MKNEAIGWQLISTAPKTSDPAQPVEVLAWVPDETSAGQGDLVVAWWEPALRCWVSDSREDLMPVYWHALPQLPAELNRRVMRGSEGDN